MNGKRSERRGKGGGEKWEGERERERVSIVSMFTESDLGMSCTNSSAVWSLTLPSTDLSCGVTAG